MAKPKGANPISKELLATYLAEFLAKHRGRIVVITSKSLYKYLSRRGVNVGRQFASLALRNYAPRKVRVDGVVWRLEKTVATNRNRRLYVYSRAVKR